MSRSKIFFFVTLLLFAAGVLYVSRNSISSEPSAASRDKVSSQAVTIVQAHAQAPPSQALASHSTGAETSPSRSPDQLQQRFVEMASMQKDAAFEVSFKASIASAMQQYYGHDQYDVHCSNLACRVSSAVVGRDGATLCDVLPYRIGWQGEILCLGDSNEVLLARGGR